MKFSVAILLAALASGAVALPAGLVLGYQDTLGQYSFGYSAPYLARSEARSVDGVTRGSYSYVDGAGLIQSTDYTADGENGFRVAATNLPQAPLPVQDTPQVAAARAAHLRALEEARGNFEAPKQPELESVPIVPRIADPVEEAGRQPKEEAAPSGPSEPIIEAAAEAAEVSAPEAKTVIESAVAEEAADKEPQLQESGRAIEEPAVAPVIASAAASLPVPLIPVNFDLPSISAYTARPAGAKADQTLPQSTPAQGGITPAGTTLKTLAAPQLVAVAPRITLASEPAARIAPEVASGSAMEWANYERARAVFAPVGPVNIIPLGYDPAISSYYRYAHAPFPYIAYNVL